MGVADVPEIVCTFEEYSRAQGYVDIAGGTGWRKGLLDGLSEERAEPETVRFQGISRDLGKAVGVVIHRLLERWDTTDC